jgi:hypothetical protein
LLFINNYFLFIVISPLQRCLAPGRHYQGNSAAIMERR